MPRNKTKPFFKRQLIDDTLIDDTQQQQLETSLRPTQTKRSKNSKKKVYDFVVDTDFQKFLTEANFYLTINYFDKSPTEDQIPDCCHCLLGSFSVNFCADNPFDSCFDINSINNRLLYIYVKSRPFETHFYYECNQTKAGKNFSIDFQSNNTNKSIDFDFIDSLFCNQIYLTTNLDFNNNCISIDVWLNNSGLKVLAFHSEPIKPNQQILRLMNYFYDFPVPIEPETNDISNEGVEQLYSQIKANHMKNKDNIPNVDVQHPALYPTLRSYQTEAVQWMLQRERIDTIASHQSVCEQINTIDGKFVNYNKYSGFFVHEKSFPLKYIYGVSQSGILADEMGLGKTIEVLSCILCNPKPPNDYSINEYFEIDITDDINYDNFDKNFNDCFACVCGEVSDVCEYKRKNAVFYPNNEVIVDEDADADQTDVDSDNTIDEELDAEYQSLLDEYPQNVRKVVVHKEVGNRKVVKMIQRKSKKKTIKKKKKPKLKTIVECRGCGSYQHSVCVNYDTTKGKPYFCGHCWVKEGMKPVESRATLIVSPRSISHQWQEEITKHIDCSNLNIFVYEGIKSEKGYIQPFDLADNDIVLTTYETFRSEIDFVNLHHSNRFRFPKRFNSTPSPLIAVNWWRICLDEAQMVESAFSKTAQMAHNLFGNHRWCITGTPIQKSINDIYGLLYFIGEEPFHQQRYWQSMLFWPYTQGNTRPMITALSRCFWRTSKKDVWEQLGIPIQTTSMKTLKFSPVEQHFYLRQHLECRQKFTEKMIKYSNLDIRLNELDRKTANVIMTPLLSLRQACCHPQAVRGKFLPISKKTLTMEELLKTMIKNTQYECEEEHRKIIASFNGIAALHIIQEDFEKAIDFYRKALNSIENYKAKDLFRTDKLQQYHTLHNLSEVFEKCGIKQKDKDSDQFYNKENEEQTTTIAVSVEIGRTLRDEYLKYESIQIHDEYLSKGSATLREVTEQLNPLIETVEDIENSFNLSNTNPWWKSAISYLKRNDEEYNLITRVRETLEQHSLRGTLGEEQLSKFVSISSKFRESSGLIYILDKCLRELHHTRSVLKMRIKNLNPNPTQKELDEAIDCHLRPVRDKDGNRADSVVKCKYCLIHEMFNNYEMKLYYFSAEEKVEESACKSSALMEKQRRGNWGDSETEQSLKVVHHLFRSKSNGTVTDNQIIEDAKNHSKLFDALKKEFKGLRAVWIETFDFVSLIDELNMATIRLRLRYSDEPKPKETITYILESHEVPVQLETLKSDEVIARNALSKKLSHLYYLNNLSKDDSFRKGGRNIELCPICQNTMGDQWSVLQCGHCLCVRCLEILISQYARRSGTILTIACALCRESCPVSALLYVNSNEEELSSESIEVKGSWSTKIEEVVRCVLNILSGEPTAKTLVFSTWTDVLHLISNAFLENDIKHCFIKHSTKFSENIDNFKQNKDIKALLMQLDFGSKGLNLIEATHVVLVEPTLNGANEQQAVGRVHRIGQTKPTFVHKFIVRNTIEERIYDLYSNDSQTQDKNVLQLAETSEHAFITLNQMRQLFDS